MALANKFFRRFSYTALATLVGASVVDLARAQSDSLSGPIYERELRIAAHAHK
jgi:hypothetical protein